MNVALNENVARHGISGTWVALATLREALERLPNVHLQRLRNTTVRPVTRVARAATDVWWDMYAAARAARCGVILHPANVGRGRRGVTSCLVVHDTMVLDRPEWFDRAYVSYARLTFGVSVRSAALVMTPSVASKTDVLRRWPSANVRVLPWPSRLPKVPVPRSHAPTLRVVVVAATEPRKNHLVAIEAVRLLRLLTRLDVVLVMIGPRGLLERRVMEEARMLDPNGLWLLRRANVTDVDLVAELDSAWVMLAPSAHEGFGLPVVEAAARALPVLHSGAGALREVMPAGIISGDAYDYADALWQLLDSGEYARASAAAWETIDATYIETFQTKLEMYLNEIT